MELLFTERVFPHCHWDMLHHSRIPGMAQTPSLCPFKAKEKRNWHILTLWWNVFLPTLHWKKERRKGREAGCHVPKQKLSDDVRFNLCEKPTVCIEKLSLWTYFQVHRGAASISFTYSKEIEVQFPLCLVSIGGPPRCFTEKFSPTTQHGLVLHYYAAR